MMNRYIALLFVSCSLTNNVHAQQLPTMNVTDTAYIHCPWDTLQTIQTFNGWEAYQTMNNEWDGPRDSTICIDLFELFGNYPQPRLRFDQCDIGRAVFVRTLIDSATAIALDTNNIYSVYTTPYPSDWTALDTSTNCPGGLCTGAMVAVRVPDSLGTSTLLRWHQGGFTQPWFGTGIDFCIPTERMSGNAIREFIFRFTPTPGSSSEFIDLNYIDLVNHELNNGVQRITEASMPQFNFGQFYYQLPSFGESNLVLYEDSTYPSSQFISYLDVYPIPNVGTPSTVTIDLPSYANLAFQPFAQFRAGHVLNNDSVFHNLTFYNEGQLCMSYYWVEVVWAQGSRYVHAGGDVHLEGANSCFKFAPGSTLEVAPDVRFDYGSSGRGILALLEGSHLLIQPGAELVLHNMVALLEPAGATLPGRLETILGIGSKLTFAPGAKINNAYSINGSMKWFIYLDGGVCDITALSAEDQQKIVLVPLPDRAAGELSLAGSVVSDLLTFNMAVRAEGDVRILVVDASGRRVVQGHAHVLAGGNTVNVSVNTLRSGSYLIEVNVGGERRTARFIKA